MGETFVVVESFDYQPQAATAKALLETKGIEVVLTDVETTNAEWPGEGWMGGIKLSVPQRQAEAARVLLRKMRQVDRKSAEARPEKCLACQQALPDGATKCPKCGWTFQSAAAESE